MGDILYIHPSKYMDEPKYAYIPMGVFSIMSTLKNKGFKIKLINYALLFNIAGILGENGKKILVIDIDPQGNSTNNFGIESTTKNLKTIKDILEQNVKFDDVVIKNCFSPFYTDFLTFCI